LGGQKYFGGQRILNGGGTHVRCESSVREGQWKKTSERERSAFLVERRYNKKAMPNVSNETSGGNDETQTTDDGCEDRQKEDT